MFSDFEIIKGIAGHDNSVLGYVYREFYPYVETYIKQHGGTEEQAKDIFQDAMIIVYKKIEDGKFTLHCKFSTYLYAVSKRIWIQERKKYILQMNKLRHINQVAEPDAEYGQETLDEMKELFENHFNQLSDDCKKILMMHFNGAQLEEIRKEMGINSVHHTADKKYRCKKNLVDRIRKDPKFRKFKK